MKDIIATNLLAQKSSTQTLPKKKHVLLTYKGCKLPIPTFDAIAPSKKGKNAVPACPNPAIQPIDAVNIQRGRIRVA